MFPPMVQGYCPAGTSGQLAEILSPYKQSVYSFDLCNLAGASFRARAVTIGRCRLESTLTPSHCRPKLDRLSLAFRPC
jgi:hypothetical protein